MPIILFILFITLLAYRQKLSKQPRPRVYIGSFKGDIYQVSHCYIGIKEATQKPHRTVIGMHGLLEPMNYFNDVYEQADTQLISINGAKNHLAVDRDNYPVPDWSERPPYHVGTIEYDAYILNLALMHAATSKVIRIHGHSRGGAVVIEAVAQRPDLHRNKNIEYILEAPLLPGFLPTMNTVLQMNPLFIWMLPFINNHLSRIRNTPTMKKLLGLERLSDERADFISSLMFNTKDIRTLEINIINLLAWARKRSIRHLPNMPQMTVLIASKDEILNTKNMRQQASKVDWLTIKEVKGSHWQVFQNPEHFELKPLTNN